ncbi:HIT family hydrolase, diadenosine tetraphosphate hydrolase [secondary endosymbiont of Heteropsylla cubana]|uniref:HIT family hydrolase, diadenosine tetraphosphate hydrolase n=1 Tax=secondary endosymbiont of Heteropsylla cubana TaxID=134287 RepID=J3TGX2_9ENTR|nr:HIT domain-containing protein [secondary endosymbiont of Heteropsylla cubana]AFP85777.1 HIT family hydrolase, diadenosine tetraphosphate hydrolase [secondary endosymbiont of Heteropsylla cubana]
MCKKTIFSKIISREIPADILYQDSLVTAFRDINPQAPIHILIVTNIEIPTVNDITIDHENMLGHLFSVAVKMAQQEGIDKEGYRLIVNCNQNGEQEIYHFHMHLLGGKRLGIMVSE